MRGHGVALGCGCWACRLRRGTRRRSSVHRVWQGALARAGEASQIWQCSAECMLPLPALQGRLSGPGQSSAWQLPLLRRSCSAAWMALVKASACALSHSRLALRLVPRLGSLLLRQRLPEGLRKSCE